MGAKNVKEENPPPLDFLLASITCSTEDDRGCMSGRACCDDTHTHASMKCNIKSPSPRAYEPSRTIYYAPISVAGDQVSTIEGDTPTTSTQKTVRSILRSGDQRSIADAHGRIPSSAGSVSYGDSRMFDKSGRSQESREREHAVVESTIMELQRKNENVKAQIKYQESLISSDDAGFAGKNYAIVVRRKLREEEDVIRREILELQEAQKDLMNPRNERDSERIRRQKSTLRQDLMVENGGKPKQLLPERILPPTSADQYFNGQ